MQDNFNHATAAMVYFTDLKEPLTYARFMSQVEFQSLETTNPFTICLIRWDQLLESQAWPIKPFRVVNCYPGFCADFIVRSGVVRLSAQFPDQPGWRGP